MKKKPKKPKAPKFLVKKTNRNRPAKPLAKPSDIEAQCVQNFQRIQFACETMGLVVPDMKSGPHIAFQVIANNLELCNFMRDGLLRIHQVPLKQECVQTQIAFDALRKVNPDLYKKSDYDDHK